MAISRSRCDGRFVQLAGRRPLLQNPPRVPHVPIVLVEHQLGELDVAELLEIDRRRFAFASP